MLSALACAAVLAAEPPASPPLATWSAKRVEQTSPACSAGVADRFIQYADRSEEGALHLCLWWHLRKTPPDVGCWRIDLQTGAYESQGGVWFSAPQPLRVGAGGGPSLPGAELTAAPIDGGIQVCRGAQCRPFALPGVLREDRELVFDARGELAAVPLERTKKARAASFALLALDGGVPTTFAIADRHEGAEAVAFAGGALMTTDCDARDDACDWALYEPRSGKRIAAVGGSRPLGAGGTAAMLDARRFAAVAGNHLVIQDAATGEVTARLELPKSLGRADYVVLERAGTVVAAGPDGRIMFIDPTAGKMTRTISPPPCVR